MVTAQRRRAGLSGCTCTSVQTLGGDGDPCFLRMVREAVILGFAEMTLLEGVRDMSKLKCIRQR